METYFDSQVKELREKAKEIINPFSHDIISEDFKIEFFRLVDKVNLSLMEDKDNFYGFFLFQMSREIRFDIGSPTAVNFKRAKYIIYFNPIIFLDLDIKQMESTIKHEILHIVSMHLIRAKELKGRYSPLAVNMAMDIVVNKYLDFLPAYATTLEWVNLKFGLHLAGYKSFEYYVDPIQKALDLREDEDTTEEDRIDDSEADTQDQFNIEAENQAEENKAEDNKADDSSNGTKDNYKEIEKQYSSLKTHDIWEESSDIDEKIFREFTEKVIRNSEKGEIPTYLKSMISSLKSSGGELPWNLYLNRLMGTVESNKKKTVTRRNRRQPDRLDLRGQLRSHKANIVVAFDISGSISDEEFNQAMQEVLSIVKNYNHEITILECDNVIRRIYKVKSERDIQERTNQKGATKFNPVFEYANKNKVNLLVYFTDGKGEDRLKIIPRGYEILWVISGRGNDLSLKVPYGEVKKLCNIELKDNILGAGDVEKGGYSMNHQESIL